MEIGTEISLDLSPDLEQEIHDFIDGATDKVKYEMGRFKSDGENILNAFVLYSIDYALKKAGKAKQREWGSGVAEIVNETIASNTEAHAKGEWWNVRGIGRSFLVEAGQNPVTVKRWLDENKELIDAHHAAMGIDDIQKHNRQAVAARKKIG